MMWRKMWVWFLVVLAVAAAFRLWQIDVIPPGFHFDESIEGLEAWRILTDPAYRPVYLASNFGIGPLNAYANAVTFGVFRSLGGEIGPTAMRTTAAIFGILGVVAVWLAAGELRRLDPQRLTGAFPLFAAALLATLRWHVHFSRMGIEPIIVPLEWAGAVWLLLRGYRTRGWLNFVGCGVVIAASVYTYQGAWFLPPLLALNGGMLWLYARRHPTLRADGVSLLVGGAIAAGVAVLLLTPLAFYFFDNAELFLLRPGQIALGSAGAATRQSPLESSLAYLLMFVPLAQQGDLDPRRNLPGVAALNLWQAIPFWAGVALATWRVRNPAYNIPLLGVVVLILPGVLSEYAPHYHRVLGASTPVAVVAAVGLDALWRLWATRDATRTRLAWVGWVSVLLVAAGAFIAARDYFTRWAALPDLYYAFDEGLWVMGQELAARPATDPLYLTPRTAEHPTLAFALLSQPGSAPPVAFDGRHIIPLTAGSNSRPEHYVVIEGDDFRTRLLLPELFPNATVTQEWRDDTGEVYARTYTRPAGSPPQRAPMAPSLLAVGDGIRLAGYDAQRVALDAGAILYVQLYWDVESAPTHDWTVFVHLFDAAGEQQLVTGADSQPGAGSLTTPRWQPGWRILDEYQLALPADLAPGDYTLTIGLYDAAGGRLPADGGELTVGAVRIE
jgi:hypothetical protein